MPAKKRDAETVGLEILSPERFRSLDEIRDFLTGRQMEAMRYVIDNALEPELCDDFDIWHLSIAGILADARKAASGLNHDLEALTKAALSPSKKLRATTIHPALYDINEVEKCRRALLLVGLGTSSGCDQPSDWIREAIFSHLGDESGMAQGGA